MWKSGSVHGWNNTIWHWTRSSWNLLVFVYVCKYCWQTKAIESGKWILITCIFFIFFSSPPLLKALWAIVITWWPLSSSSSAEAFHISICFSETTITIWTKLGWNGHYVVLRIYCAIVWWSAGLVMCSDWLKPHSRIHCHIMGKFRRWLSAKIVFYCGPYIQDDTQRITQLSYINYYIL